MTLPPADSISIAKDGSIWTVPQGGDPAQPQQVDKLKLVSPTGTQIDKGVDGIFREGNGGALHEDPEDRGTAEALEGYNVNPTEPPATMKRADRTGGDMKDREYRRG